MSSPPPCPPPYPKNLLRDIGRDVLELFREARAAQMPLAEISLQFGSLHITARELRGGADHFPVPANRVAPDANPLTPMTPKDINQLVTQIETHIECWKQFNHFISLARAKKFGPADDIHFLEIKSIIVQEIGLIFASIEVASPTREEIHGLITNAPSLRSLSEMSEGGLRGLETQWHKIYIGWHAILGQLKVKQRAEEAKSFWGEKK